MQTSFSDLTTAQQHTIDAILATIQELATLDRLQVTYTRERGYRARTRVAVEVRPDLVLHYEVTGSGHVMNSLRQNPTQGIGHHEPLGYHFID